MGHDPLKSRAVYLKTAVALIVFLMLTSASQQILLDGARGDFPGYTITGLVRNEEAIAIKNASVTVENLRTGDVQSTTTDLLGRYTVDLSDYPAGYQVGDIVLSSAFKNGFGGSNTGEIFSGQSGTIVNITITDVLVPEFANPSCTGNKADEPLDFSVNVSDNIEIMEVYLYCLPPNGADFEAHIMAQTSGNFSDGEWEVQLPDIKVTGTLYYYFSAEDTSGNKNTTSIFTREIVHGDVFSFSVNAPVSTVAGEDFTITIIAQDIYGNVVTNYSEEVAVGTNDPTYPSGGITSYDFTPGDNGSHDIHDIKLYKTPSQWLYVEDVSNGGVNGSSLVMVSPGEPDALGIVPDNSTVPAGHLQLYTLILYDEYMNPTAADMDYEIGLSSDSATGQFIPLPDVTLKEGEGQVFVFYNDTISSPFTTSTITADNPALGTAVASIRIISSNGSYWTIEPDYHTAAAGEMILLSIQLKDSFGNPVTMSEDTEIKLMTSSDSGIFLTNASVIETITMAAGDDIVYCYYLDNVSRNIPTIIRINNGTFCGDGLSVINITSSDVSRIQLQTDGDMHIAGREIDLTLSVFDAHDNPTVFSTTAFRLSSTDELADDIVLNLSGNGFAGFVYTLYTSGPQELTAEIVGKNIESFISLNIMHGLINDLKISAIYEVEAGKPFSCVLTILDLYNNTVVNYSGEVGFSSDDEYPAVLPSPYIFSASDGGSHLFENEFILYTTPSRKITALAMNEDISITEEVSVFDNVMPTAEFNREGYENNLGPDAEFTIRVSDNIRIEKVRLHYSYDNTTFSYVDMTQATGNYSSGMGNYSAEISGLPSGNLYIYFSVFDGSNVVKVFDNGGVPYIFEVNNESNHLLIYVILIVLISGIIASILFYAKQKSIK